MINADEDGNVVLLWAAGARRLTLYVGEHDTTFLRSWGTSLVAEMDEGELALPNDLKSLLRWLTGEG
jgi:hypothetical protein